MRTWQKAITGCIALALTLALAVPAVAQEVEEAPATMPMDGTLVGAHWIDPAAPACDLPETSWRFYNTGAGQISGLGEVEVFTTHCAIFDAETGGAESDYYHRSTIFTTAEGDTLSVIHDVPVTEVFADEEGNFTGFNLIGTWEAVGGTGRFTNAVGTGTLEGAADIPGDIVLDFTGEIMLAAPAPMPEE